MSRIDYPVEFSEQVNLFELLAKKIAADPDKLLDAFLAEHAIDLTVDTAAKAKAQAHQAQAQALQKQASSLYADRDQLAAPAIETTNKVVQHIKSYYRPKYQAAGDWGITITATGKVKYPKGVDGYVALLSAITTKDASYDAKKSPIYAFLTTNKIVLTATATELGKAKAKQDAAEQVSKDSEKETQQRDLAWAPVWDHVHLICNHLKTLYPNDTKTLGNWGIKVNDSKQAPKGKVITLAPGETRLGAKVGLNSTLTLTKGGPVELHRGKKLGSEPVLLEAGKPWVAMKGYSLATMVNKSALDPAVITIQPYVKPS